MRTLCNTCLAGGLGFLALIFTTVSVAEPSNRVAPAAQFSPEAYAALGAFRGMAEEHAARVLRTLRVIAESNDAKSGKWDLLKPLLMRLSHDLETAATAWFVLPDGSYYETKTGEMGEPNLKDKAYFARLISAKEVFAELVIGDISDRRSVIIAVPIVSPEGKVVGGVGVSLRVQLLSQLVGEHLKLPDNEYFYALEGNNRIVLHQNADRMFTTAKDVGDEALGQQLLALLKQDRGDFEYILEGKKVTAIYERSPDLQWCFLIAKTG